MIAPKLKMRKWTEWDRRKGTRNNRIRAQKHRYKVGELIRCIGEKKPYIKTDMLIRVVQKYMKSRRRKPQNAQNISRYTNKKRSLISPRQIVKVIQEYWYRMPREFIEERERRRMIRQCKKEDMKKVVMFVVVLGYIICMISIYRSNSKMHTIISPKVRIKSFPVD